MTKSSSTSSMNGNGHGALVDGSEDAEARAEQGGLVGLRGMKASPGRPNISAVLSRVVQEYSTEQEIGVVAAGDCNSLRIEQLKLSVVSLCQQVDTKLLSCCKERHSAAHCRVTQGLHLPLRPAS